MQVAYGLIGFWDSMLDTNNHKQPQCGLTKLLDKYDLAAHTTKQGKLCNERLRPLTWLGYMETRSIAFRCAKLPLSCTLWTWHYLGFGLLVSIDSHGCQFTFQLHW